jgi:hypothetical protein
MVSLLGFAIWFGFAAIKNGYMSCLSMLLLGLRLPVVRKMTSIIEFALGGAG